MNNPIAAPTERQLLEKQSHAAVTQAQGLAVVDGESYQSAGNVLKSHKTLLKRIDAELDPIIRAQREALDAQRALKKRLTDPVEQAEAIIKGKMLTFQQAEEAKRRAEELRLREEARKAEEERRLAEAVAAEQNGQPEVAEAIIAEPVVAPPIVLPKATPKVDGISSRKIFKFKIVDERLIPREYMKVDEVKIGQYARMQKGQGNIPGVEFYAEETMSAGAF